MKSAIFISCLLVLAFTSGCGTNSENQSENGSTESSETSTPVGQSGVHDDQSAPNIVQVAVGSKEHTTLVTAVQAAQLVDALSNAGPFTVFAPVNAAFDKLPPGTVDDLLKPENKDKLTNILGYHTYVGVINGILLQDGAQFDMVFGGKIKITKKGDKTYVNGNEILTTITASNGVIHVIDQVLLPK